MHFRVLPEPVPIFQKALGARPLSFLLPSLLIFLAPLALYLSFLAYLNRRNQPTLVPGTWDCGAMLFAIAGFFLYGGPMLLNHLYHSELARLPVEVQANDKLYDAIWLKWRMLWGLYFLMLLAFSGLLVWLRHGATVIYNVDVERFRTVMIHTLEEMNLEFRVAQGRILLMPKNGENKDHPGSAALRIESFPATAHITLVWHDQGQDLRTELEKKLVRNLPAATAWNNPCTLWLMGLSGLVAGVVFFLLGIWITRTFISPPRW
jgi:hypothetical protein